MNVQEITSKIQSLWHRFIGEEVDAAANQERVMTEEEMLDESLKDSFPASDPPGHFSKSVEDKDLH